MAAASPALAPTPERADFAWVMRFFPRVLAPSLIVLAAAAALAGCASTASPPPEASAAAALRPAEAAEAATDSRTSAYGLYLAGEAALDSGANAAAERFLSRASERAPDAPLIRERAFTAALLAGDTARAAELAPQGAGVQPLALSLGRLARGVEALASGRAKEAEAELTPPAGDKGPNGPALLVRPWAAAAAG